MPVVSIRLFFSQKMSIFWLVHTFNADHALPFLKQPKYKNVDLGLVSHLSLLCKYQLKTLLTDIIKKKKHREKSLTFFRLSYFSVLKKGAQPANLLSKLSDCLNVSVESLIMSFLWSEPRWSLLASSHQPCFKHCPTPFVLLRMQHCRKHTRAQLTSLWMQMSSRRSLPANLISQHVQSKVAHGGCKVSQLLP